MGTEPGGGGAGDEEGGLDGARGEIQLKWLGKALSAYYRTNGSIPSHSANLNIPTSPANLKISQFSGAELNFSATVTVGNNGGGEAVGQYGYRSGSYGSINRDKVGLSRLNTSQGTIVNLYEFGVFNGLFTNYYLILEFNTDVTYSTLGHHFFDSITVNGTTFNRTNAATNQNGVYSGGVTTWDWISGVNRLLPTSGTYPVSLAFSGP